MTAIWNLMERSEKEKNKINRLDHGNYSKCGRVVWENVGENGSLLRLTFHLYGQDAENYHEWMILNEHL